MTRLRKKVVGICPMVGTLLGAGSPAAAWYELISGGFLADDLWKAGALLRIARPVRVIGEEQVRMATAGIDIHAGAAPSRRLSPPRTGCAAEPDPPRPGNGLSRAAPYPAAGRSYS